MDKVKPMKLFRTLTLLLVLGLAATACSEGPELPADEELEVLRPEITNGRADSLLGVNYRGELEYGVPRDGTLERDLQFDSYEFEAGDDAVVTLEITQEGSTQRLDSTLFVFGPQDSNGAYPSDVLTYDNDSGFARLSKLDSLVLPGAGTYLAVVGSPAGLDRGDYRLVLTCESGSCDQSVTRRCSEGNAAKPVSYHTNLSGDWRLGLRPDANYSEISLANDPDHRAATFENAGSTLHGFIVSSTAPGDIQFANPSSALQHVKDAILASGGSILEETAGQELTTHDGFQASSARYKIEVAQAQRPGALRDAILASAPLTAGTYQGGNAGGLADTEFELRASVVQRPDRLIFTAALTAASNYDSHRFELADMVNTTNVSAESNVEEAACSAVTTTQAPAKADFYFVLDQSGSMTDDYDKVIAASNAFFDTLETTGLDYRVALTDMDPANTGLPRGGWMTDRADFIQGVDDLTLNGYQEYGLSNSIEGIQQMLAVDADASIAVRADAKLITIYMSDEEDNDFQDAPLGDNRPLLNQYISELKGQTTAFALVNIEPGNRFTDGEAYREVALATGGTYTDLQLADFQQTIDEIINAAQGLSSVYELLEVPVSASLHVTQGGAEVPRSRQDGYDYFPQSNTIAFYGSYAPQPGDPSVDLTVSYQTLSAGASPSAENTNGLCSDGIDNDGDGLVDCADSDCQAAGITVCALDCQPGFHDCGGTCVPSDSVDTCGNRCTPCAGAQDGDAACINEQCVQLSSYQQVSAGGVHSCALKTDGEIACFGHDYFGQSTPPTGTFTQVSAGVRHSCAVATDGSVQCWGRNRNNESAAPSGTFTRVSAGEFHSCAVATDGSIECWGRDNHGQSTPPSDTFTEVHVGRYHACGLTTGGQALCWGRDGYGQTTPPAAQFAQLTVGPRHSCGLKSDGTAECWGSNDDGRSTPPSDTFVSISAGESYTCGVTTSGTSVCWGLDDHGQSTPSSDTFAEVSAGDEHACGLTNAGHVVCWGKSASGRTDVPN